MNDRWDAVIIGGGPAGGTAALLLARAGWSVLLVERKAFPRRKVCGEYLSATNWPLLEELGIAGDFERDAGPPVTHVGLFAGEDVVTSPLPRSAETDFRWGRAISRARLDALLLERAVHAGAEVLQPWSVEYLRESDGGFQLSARHAQTREIAELSAKVVILAHGSWEKSGLPSQHDRDASKPTDLLAFKAHFQGGYLPKGLMPLLAFPGGYGGMVHGNSGQFSVSCCIRRVRLESIRREHPASAAGESVQAHLAHTLRGFREALVGAERPEPWLSAGPIQPGVRLKFKPGLFPIGNAAGEAHPVIAEGISIAMQSAWLFARQLIEWKQLGERNADLANVRRRYASQWRRAFRLRLFASSAIAWWAENRLTIAGSLPFIRIMPSLLTCGARLSGKVNRVVTTA